MENLRRKWFLTMKVLPFAATAILLKFVVHWLGWEVVSLNPLFPGLLAATAILLKFVVHWLGWEVVSLNPLFPGLLAATVFLIGFLISGVLTDYKESEKLPGDLAVSLEALFDEGSIVHAVKGPQYAHGLLHSVIDLSASVRAWLYGKIEFEPLLAKVEDLNPHLVALEAGTVPPFIARLKVEQTSIRRSLTRIRTIKETSFVGQAYTIAEVMAAFLIAGILLARIEPFYESLFFSGLITFLLVYMLRLIKDLDDPFEYGAGAGSDEVSLIPLEDAEARMRRRLAGLS